MIMGSFYSLAGCLGFLEIIQCSQLTLFFIHLTPRPLRLYNFPSHPFSYCPSASCVSISHHAAACCQLPSRGITCLSSPLALIQQNNLAKWPQEKQREVCVGSRASFRLITPRGGDPREAFVESHGKIRHNCCCCIWLAAFWKNSWNQIIPIMVNV